MVAPALTSDVYGATAGSWMALVRRARIGLSRKAAALILASYADADGTSIYCGVARLALDMESSYSTAQRALRWLRDVGLIERVRKGNSRKGLSDVYRLILGPDVLEHIKLPDPAEYDALRFTVRDERKRTSRGPSRLVDNQPELPAIRRHPDDA